MDDKETCFVICPIGGDDTDTRRRSDLVFEYIIKPVVERYDYMPIRADYIKEPGMITSQIIDQLVESPLVIADLTDHNPNVFYELAIRHIVKKPYIQMIKADQLIPFDISTMRTIPFDIDLEGASKAKTLLSEQIEAIKNNKFKPDNPIIQAQNYHTIQKLLKEDVKSKSDNISKVAIEAIYDMGSKINAMQNEIHNIRNLVDRKSPVRTIKEERDNVSEFDLKILDLSKNIDHLYKLQDAEINDTANPEVLFDISSEISRLKKERMNLIKLRDGKYITLEWP